MYRILYISLLTLIDYNHAQMDFQPFLSLLRPENMRSMAELATEISSMAAKNVADNERDIQRTAAVPKPEIFDPNAKPSQMIGGAFSNIAYQSRSAFLDAIDKFEATTNVAPMINTMVTLPPYTFGTNTPITPPPTPSPVTLPSIFGIPPQRAKEVEQPTGRDILGVRNYQNSHENPREIRYAEPIGEEAVEVAQAHAAPTIEVAAPSAAVPAVAAERAIPLARPPPPKTAFEGSPFMQIANKFLQFGSGNGKSGGGNEPLPQIGIRDFMSNSDSNFGLPRGKGCLPFISEFMQIAYGNCQNVADEKTFDAWGEELRRAIMTGEIDLLKASQETCRRGAERQQCAALREAVANCDVMASIEIGSQLQRAMKRCEEVSGMIDQNPASVLGQLNNLITGEVAQGFLNKFLKNG